MEPLTILCSKRFSLGQDTTLRIKLIEAAYPVAPGRSKVIPLIELAVGYGPDERQFVINTEDAWYLSDWFAKVARDTISEAVEAELQGVS